MTRKSHTLLFCVLLVAACAQTAGLQVEEKKSEVLDSVRLAEAQMQASALPSLKGQFQLEQMPNSVIVTYRVEGLRPQRSYRILWTEGGSCQNVRLAEAEQLSVLKSDRNGKAQNTFKTEDHSVSEDRPLLAGALVLANVSQVVACGVVTAQAGRSAIDK